MEKINLSHSPQLVLASSSIFRQQLLQRLKIPFVCAAPKIDETPQTEELPEHLAKRLSMEKAQALATRYPHSLIIGSDQVAFANGKIYGKPQTLDHAVEQLTELSGQNVDFLSGLALLNTHTHHIQTACVVTRVGFRALTLSDIQNYLAAEPDALLCAGSARSESLGITLLEKIQSDDPSALIGLPLIALCTMLRNENVL